MMEKFRILLGSVGMREAGTAGGPGRGAETGDARAAL
jgi:hypothetical protein